MSAPSTQSTVAELTARAVAGDRAAYEALFRMRCAFVEAECARRLGRRCDLADDVAQEVWIRVARSPRRCAGDASLDAWLRRLVRSSAIDLLRSELARRARERRVATDRPEAVAFVEDLEVLEEIRRDVAAIGGISDDERAVLGSGRAPTQRSRSSVDGSGSVRRRLTAGSGARRSVPVPTPSRPSRNLRAPRRIG